MMWQNYAADLNKPVNINTFNTWIRGQAEIFRATNKPKTLGVVEAKSKPGETIPIKFQSVTGRGTAMPVKGPVT